MLSSGVGAGGSGGGGGGGGGLGGWGAIAPQYSDVCTATMYTSPIQPPYNYDPHTPLLSILYGVSYKWKFLRDLYFKNFAGRGSICEI